MDDKKTLLTIQKIRHLIHQISQGKFDRKPLIRIQICDGLDRTSYANRTHTEIYVLHNKFSRYLLRSSVICDTILVPFYVTHRSPWQTFDIIPAVEIPTRL